MTNGEKFKEIFEVSRVDGDELYAFVWLPNHDAAEFCIDWWNAEYKEPTTKSDVPENNVGKIEPTTKNDLGVASELETQNSKLEKIRAEIERQERWLMDTGYNACSVDIAFDAIKSVVAETEDT